MDGAREPLSSRSSFIGAGSNADLKILSHPHDIVCSSLLGSLFPLCTLNFFSYILSVFFGFETRAETQCLKTCVESHCFKSHC